MNTYALDEERDEPLLEAYRRLCADDVPEPSAAVREGIRAQARQFIVELSDRTALPPGEAQTRQGRRGRREAVRRPVRRLWIIGAWAGLGLAAMIAAGLYARSRLMYEIPETPSTRSVASSLLSTPSASRSDPAATANRPAARARTAMHETALRLKPPGAVGYLELAEKMVKTRFADLLESPGRQNWLVGVVFDHALNVVRVAGPTVMPEPGADQASTDLLNSMTYASTRLGLTQEDFDNGGGASVASPGEDKHAHILIWAYVLKDPAIRESNAKVRAAVLARLGYHLPRRPASGDVPLLTVLMAADGTIDRDNLEWRPSPGGGIVQDMFEADAHARFANLGASPAELGRSGTLFLTDAQQTGADCCGMLLVSYAWPLTAAAPASDGGASGPAGGNSDIDETMALAILKRHFTTQQLSDHSDGAEPWVLLDSTGEVLHTGRAVFADSSKLEAYLEAIYPGIRTDAFVGTNIKDPESGGRYIGAQFVWLAKDSPVPR